MLTIANCNYCHKPRLHESVCQLKQKNKGVQHSTPDSEMPLFDSLCTAYTLQNIKIGFPFVLNHRVFYNLCEQWLKKPSKPPLLIILTASMAQDDYSRLGHKLIAPTSTPKIFAIGDTECQSCPMEVNLLKKLAFQNRIYFPMKMHAANNNTITILGAISLTTGGKSQVNKDHTTKQIVYVTHDSDNFFLSL